MIRRFALLFRLNELRDTIFFFLESTAEMPIINVFYVGVLEVPGMGWATVASVPAIINSS